MRKSTFTILVAVFATVSAAGQVISHLSRDAQPVIAESDFAVAKQGKKTAFDAGCSKFNIMKGTERFNAPADDPLLLTSYEMNRNDSVYYISYGTNVAMASYTNRVGDILIGSDGSFYLKDPIVSQRIGTWIKGTLEDGTVSFNLPQPIAYATYEDGTVTRLMATVVELAENTYIPVEGDQVVKFSWNNESLTALDPEVKIGIVLEDTGNWTGYADWGINMTVFTDAPSSYNGYADTHDYGMSGFDYNFLYNQTLAWGIKVRIDGDQFIISGLPGAPAGSVVIGTIEEDRVTIPTQYLGVDPTYLCHVYFQPLRQHLTFDDVYIYPENDCIDTYTLLLDRDNLTLQADEDNAYSINCGKGELLTLDTRGMLNYAKLTPFDPDRAATPTTGQIYMYGNANPDWGFACFAFSMMDVDGNYIDPAQLYWRVYKDDELWPLDTEVYTGFDTDEPTVTEIPFLFNNGVNIFTFNWDYMHQISTFTAWEKLGVQLIYKAGGEERESDIFYSDQTIVSTTVKAIEDGERGLKVETTYHDMWGRKIKNPGNGIYVRTDRYSDGTIKSVKIVR